MDDDKRTETKAKYVNETYLITLFYMLERTDK